MAIMSPEVQRAIAEVKPGLIATASGSGKPNVSAKGSLRVLDDEHLAFAEIMSPNTLANLRENPLIAIICLDAPTRSGCRIAGHAEILDSGALFDQFSEEYAARRMAVRHVVKIAVDEAYTFRI